MIIGVDFDGTVVEHMFPEIGAPVPFSLSTIEKWQSQAHMFILFTMRSGDTLDQAVNYCKTNGINLFGVNKNPTQHTWTSSPKPYCHIYIDDAALGCPLIPGIVGNRPMVDWVKVDELFQLRFPG